MKANLNRLTNVTPPIMPETGRALRELLDTDTTRNPQLLPLLLNDPAAALAVFRQLEKTRPGAYERVADPAHAVSLMGQDAFRSLITALPIAEIDDERTPQTIGREHAYSQMAHASIFAGNLCEATHTEATGEIHTAALLQQPALMSLWAIDPTAARRATNAIRNGVAVDTALGAELGESPTTVNRHLAEQWALPMLAQQSLNGAEGFNNRPKLIRLADQLAQTAAAEWHNELLSPTVENLAGFLRMEPDRATSWLHQCSVDTARTLHPFGYPVAAFSLAALPGENTENDAALLEFLERRKRKTAPVESPAPAGNDLQSTLTAVMRRIREDAGTGRVVFAMLNRDRTRLRTRLALGGEPTDGLRRLDMDLSQKNLFTVLLAKPQSVWLNKGNTKKLQAYLPATLRALLGPSGGYMISLFVKNRPLGLLYGDGKALSAEGFARFCALANEATAALTAGSRPTDKGAA